METPQSTPQIKKPIYKKWWFWLFGIPLGFIAAIVIVGMIYNSTLTPEEKAAASARYQKEQDSIKQFNLVQATEKQRVEDSLAYYKEPLKYTSVDIEWNKGGFGAVALAKFKIKNESKVDISNPIVKITFYGESGTAISEKKEMLTIIAQAGKTKKTDEINLGFINSQVKSASAEIIRADY